VAPKKAVLKKDVKFRFAAKTRNGCDGRLMAKALQATF